MSELPVNVNDGSFPMPRARLNLDVGAAKVAAAATAFLPSTAPVSSLLPQLPSHQLPHLSLVNHSAAAIQAQIAALLTQGAVAAGQPLPTMVNPMLTSAAPAPLASANVNMHGWTADQIESHIKLLRQCNQHVPQTVTMLLHEAKKRAEKRHAKRIANRKSACSSRARKKALVQEMTELNTKLRRQALILSLLPDLVVVIDVEGTITFCSAQVERVLQHNVDVLVGAKLMDIIEPGSRDKLSRFIQKVLFPSKSTGLDIRNALTGSGNPRRASEKKKSKVKRMGEDEEAAHHSLDESANAVTDSSFPLSVVKVEQTNTAPGSSDENDNSDECNSKQPSSLTTNSITGNSGSDGGTAGKDGDRAVVKKCAESSSTAEPKLNKNHAQSSDSSNTSSNTETSDAKNLFTANANLDRNVRWHNKKNRKSSKRERDGFTDDVIGAAVTANNASARLSSLCHRTSDSEEDSGYRESNDSREETSSSEGEASSQSNGRRKPVAPTCNVCLIRDDLTTIWCEVTSSVRTKVIEDETDDAISLSNGTGDIVNKKPSSLSIEETLSRKLSRSEEGSMHGSEDVAIEEVEAKQCKEVLLCLRPIRDGEEKTGEKHRFKPFNLTKSGQYFISADNSGGESNASPLDGEGGEMNISNSRSMSKPLKTKKRSKPDEEIDHAVVESLISMSNKKRK